MKWSYRGHEVQGRHTGKDSRHTCTMKRARQGNRPGTEELKYRFCVASSADQLTKLVDNIWITSLTLRLSANHKEYKLLYR